MREGVGDDLPQLILRCAAGVGVDQLVSPPSSAAAKGGGGREAAWQRSLAAARQYRAREGHLTVPRQHVETMVDDGGQEHTIKLGVWLSNQRSRRTTLSAERVAALDPLQAW